MRLLPVPLLLLTLGVASLFPFAGLAAISGLNLLDGKISEIKSGPKGTVLVFLSARCPCSHSHVGILKKLSADFKDFSFVVAHSNTDEPIEEGKTYFKAAGFSFPVLRDEKSHLADEFKALKTPHAYLLSPDGKILYKGGITNSANGEKATKHFLRDALSDANAGQAIRQEEGRTLGCVITR